MDFGGRPALARLIETLAEAGVARGVAVVGEHGPPLAEAVDPAPLRWVANPDPEAGRMGSIRVGLLEVPAEAGVLLWPVDRPLASAATVAALLEAASAHPTHVLRPRAGGRPGHPIFLPADLRPALLAAAPDASLRDVIRGAPVPPRDVPVDDPGIHFDLDSEARVAEAVAWWRDEAPRRREDRRGARRP